ncbi:hypothetical protein SAMN05428943_1033 [Streptomyces sp. 2314.4]|nr:hypothetical protein SAMN05428943_1033 [Streptomyces sp. 2314.4]
MRSRLLGAHRNDPAVVGTWCRSQPSRRPRHRQIPAVLGEQWTSPRHCRDPPGSRGATNSSPSFVASATSALTFVTGPNARVSVAIAAVCSPHPRGLVPTPTSGAGTPTAAPRTRGDGPVVGVAAVAPISAPRTRGGCSPAAEGAQPYPQLLPTPAASIVAASTDDIMATNATEIPPCTPWPDSTSQESSSGQPDNPNETCQLLPHLHVLSSLPGTGSPALRPTARNRAHGARFDARVDRTIGTCR